MNSHYSTKILLVAVAGFLLACNSPKTHTDTVLDWRAERQASLQRPDGWLTLIGLYWLMEGDNPFGSDSSNAVVFPQVHMPPVAGNFHLKDGIVTITIDPGVGVTVDGAPISNMELLSDVTGTPTVLSLGTLTFLVINRAGALAIRIKDSASAALAGFKGLDYYPIDEKWRIMATFNPSPSGTRGMVIPTFQGPSQILESPGSVEFEIDGEPYSLDVFIEEGDTEYFIIFGDQTNGSGSYGGGRFLTAATADKDGMVVLDFNLAYSPPCVFTPFATCPLPPLQNRLPIRIAAGEKAYAYGVDLH